MLPLSLLKTAQNHPMLVELKNGETYNGHLVSCDNWMNINLREVICTSRVCLAAGAEVGSRAQAEASQRRSRADRRANSEPTQTGRCAPSCQGGDSTPQSRTDLLRKEEAGVRGNPLRVL
uniref:U6 snRNA-associated Sm-like protein LSm4 n=1 Tax=Macaca fascicularis TaxID=9541 RepID=A0A2K5UUD0_MACFA